MKNATTHIFVKKIINEYIPHCGKPRRILSVNGTQFTSPPWKSRLELEGIRVVYSSIQNPQSNPTERVMREIGRLFRTFCSSKHTTWIDYVKRIENPLNITTHFSTGYTPIELHFGKTMKDEIHKIIEFPVFKTVSHEHMITLARKKMQTNFENCTKNQKISRIKIKENDLVMLRVRHLSNALDKVTRKFFHLFEGPYKVLRRLGENAFLLVDPHNNDLEIGVYNRANLRKYYSADK